LKQASVLSRPFLAMLALALGADAAAGFTSPAPVDDVVADAALVHVYGDQRFFEGPTWDPAGGKLFFTAFGPNNESQILRLDDTDKALVFKDKSQGTNGTWLARDGRLLGAQGFCRSIVAYDLQSGAVETLAHDDSWNAPNDICQAPNGDIYFTDPDFEKGEKSGVYRIAGGKVTKVVSDMAKPNGCITSRDGRTLYVSDSEHKHWKSFPIAADGAVGPGRVFFDPQTENRDSPDGMSIDEHGNLYFTGRGGVWVVTPDGKTKGLIGVPEFCSNVTFGGPDGKTLYLTCDKRVYRLAMRVRGAQFVESSQ
jgi:gluconolactonase